MIDWNVALKLFMLSIAGTFLVMGALTAIITLISKFIARYQREKKS